MPCGCGKKSNGTVHFMGHQTSDVPDSEEWGPILWKYLHCLTEKVGFSYNTLIDNDQASHMEFIISSLHYVIPCPECQSHAATYIHSNPLPTLRGLHGNDMRSTLRIWLFNFHNHVRTIKGQPLTVKTPEECTSLYSNCFLPKCEYNLFVQNVAYAVRQGWVKIENWRKWYSHSERIRILIGNVIV
jgi:hypothetical protein